MNDKGVLNVTGAEMHRRKDLPISFGVADREEHVATLDAEEPANPRRRFGNQFHLVTCAGRDTDL